MITPQHTLHENHSMLRWLALVWESRISIKTPTVLFNNTEKKICC